MPRQTTLAEDFLALLGVSSPSSYSQSSHSDPPISTGNQTSGEQGTGSDSEEQPVGEQQTSPTDQSSENDSGDPSSSPPQSPTTENGFVNPKTFTVAESYQAFEQEIIEWVDNSVQKVRARELVEKSDLRTVYVELTPGIPAKIEVIHYRDGNGRVERLEFRVKSESLKIQGIDGNWFIFNRSVFRDEVVKYMWGNRLDSAPSIDELLSQQDLNNNGFKVPDTHWQIPEHKFGTRPELYQKMRPEIRAVLERLQDQPIPESIPGIPKIIWDDFNREIEDRLYSYPITINADPDVKDGKTINTNLVLIKRNQKYAGAYYKRITDLNTVRGLLDAEPPDFWNEFFGKNPKQKFAESFVEENEKFNDFMEKELQDSMISVSKAYEKYEKDAKNRLITSILEAFGLVAGGSVGTNYAQLAIDLGNHPWVTPFIQKAWDRVFE